LDVIEFAKRGKDEPLATVPDFTTREIAFVAQHERVEHLDDLLLRRSLLAMLGKVDRDAIKEVGGIVAKTLGWKAKQRDEEIDRSVKILAEQHGMTL
jgi:glycerol-3-phosphate dehydrogenase